MGNLEIKNSLYLAITANNLDQVSKILKASPQLINEPISDDLNTTALIRAAYINRPHILTQLLEAGADVNLTGASQISALMWSAIKGHLHCCQVLVEYNASLSQIGPHEMTAMDFAVLYGRYESAWFLKKEGAGCIKNPEQLECVRNEKDLPYVDYAGFLLSLGCEMPPEVVPSFIEPPIDKTPAMIDPISDPNESWKKWMNRVLEFREAPKVERQSVEMQQRKISPEKKEDLHAQGTLRIKQPL